MVTTHPEMSLHCGEELYIIDRLLMVFAKLSCGLFQFLHYEWVGTGHHVQNLLHHLQVQLLAQTTEDSNTFTPELNFCQRTRSL